MGGSLSSLLVRLWTRVPMRRVLPHGEKGRIPGPAGRVSIARKEARDGASSVGLSRRLDLIPLVDLEGSAASDRLLHRLFRRGRARRTRARGGALRLDPAESRDEESAGELRCPPVRVQVRLTLVAVAQMSLDLSSCARTERRLEVVSEERDRVPTGHRLAAAVMVLSRLRCLLRSEEHTSELQSRLHLVCRLLLE